MRVRVLVFASLTITQNAYAFTQTSLGREEGHFDADVNFTAELGQVEPTERPTTFQTADIKILSGGVGYIIGRVGPLMDFYVRLEGAYESAAEEEVEDDSDDLPLGYRFFDRDRGGFITAVVATNFVHETRYAFGAYLHATIPIDVDFQKFSNVRLHYVGGGTTLGIFLTDPSKIIRVAYANRLFLGSGAYVDDFQHNASIAMANLFVLEAARWALPWRLGISFGPYFEGDLNEHVNARYDEAYGSVSPDLVAGDRVRSMRLAIAVLPYFRVTDRAAVELGYVQNLFGYDLPATQVWTAGVRASF